MIVFTWMIGAAAFYGTPILAKIATLPAGLLTETHMYEYMWGKLPLLADNRKEDMLNSVLEDLGIYETYRYKEEIMELAARVRKYNIWLAVVGVAILILILLFGKILQYVQKIHHKNIEMVDMVQELLLYRDRFYECENERTELNVKDSKNASPVPVKEKEENAALFRKLDDIVTTEKLFLRQDVSRDDLMKCIGVDKNRLSRILKQNVSENTTVTDYINNKRMEYAAELLKAHPEYNIATIANMCGISVSSFNRAFKYKYKMTPNDFRSNS